MDQTLQKCTELGAAAFQPLISERVERDASPDLLINYVGYGTDMTDIEGITKQVAPGVKWIGDPQAHSMRSYREGTLVFEVVDTESGEMVWSGWVTELAPDIEAVQADIRPGLGGAPVRPLSGPPRSESRGRGSW